MTNDHFDQTTGQPIWETIFEKKAFTSYKKVVQFLAFPHNIRYFCSGVCLIEKMEGTKVIDSIRQVAARVLPKGSSLYLYGSRARGDYHEDSDWDLLLLLDKPYLTHEDFDKYSYPFVEMGWDIGEDIRPHAYTKEEWHNGPHAMFYYNVEEDKKIIYGLN